MRIIGGFEGSEARNELTSQDLSKRCSEACCLLRGWGCEENRVADNYLAFRDQDARVPC